MTPEKPTIRSFSDVPKGRPRSKDGPRPRPHTVTIRLNDPEFAELVSRAQRTSRSVTGEVQSIVTRVLSGKGVS